MNILHIIYGAIIGVANIIPGVSGGTMAVILKIYDKLIGAVSNITKDFKNSFMFLLPIGIGALVGIVLFSKVIEFTLENFPAATNMAFVGLIVGSVPMIVHSISRDKVNPSIIVSFCATLALMLIINRFNPQEGDATITSLNLINFVILFFASVVASGAMIIPGISGSFVMLVLGVYTSVLAAISGLTSMDTMLNSVLLLIPVGLGCLVGILGCAKIMEKLFSNFPNQTYSGILGFMIGSIFVILPPIGLDITSIIAIVVGIATFFLAYFFSKSA